MSDSESILTEDFAAKFQETQEKLLSKDPPLLSKLSNVTESKSKPLHSYEIPTTPPSILKLRDNDSIRTEDFQTEFRRFMVVQDEGGNKWFRGTTLSSSYGGAAVKASRPHVDTDTSAPRGAPLRTTPYRSGGFIGVYNSHEDLSTLPDSASEAGAGANYVRNAPPLPTRTVTTSNPVRTIQPGNLSSISPIRRDIMSKFLEKYGGTSDAGAAGAVKRVTMGASPHTLPASPVVAFRPSRNTVVMRDPLTETSPQLPGSTSWKTQVGLRHSIAVPRHTVSPIPEMRTYSDDDISAEIRTKSEQIQREIQEERHRRAPQPGTQTTNTNGTSFLLNSGNLSSAAARAAKQKSPLTPRETLDEKMKEVDRISQSLREAHKEKQRMTEEMLQMEEALRKQKAEVRLSSKLIQDRRSKAQSIHTELVQAEARRDETQKYLDELNLELVKRKQTLEDLEKTLKQRMHEVKSMEEVGLTKEEIESVIAERNELYEIIKLSEENESQKYELEKQLTLAREDLTIEQRRYRERIETLEEELEASLEKISSLQADREECLLRLESLDVKCHTCEADLEALIQENRRLIQENAQMRQTTSMMQNQSESMEVKVRQELEQVQHENQQMQNDLTRVKRDNNDLKEQVAQLERQLHIAEERQEEMRKSHQLRVQSLEKEHAQSLEQWEDKLRSGSQSQVSQLRTTWEMEKQDALDGVKRWYEEQMRQLLQSNRELQTQNETLTVRLGKQENDMQSLLQENAFDEKAKIKRAVNRERERWEEEQEERWRRELSAIRAEAQDLVQTAQAETQRERDKSKSLQDDLEAAKNNLQTVEENLKARFEREKQLEHSKKQTELEKRKELTQLQQEMENVIRTKETELAQREKHLQELSEQKKSLDVKHLELQTNLRKMGLIVIGEVREECRRMMECVKMELPKFKHDKENVPVDQIHEAVWDALANLRACAEEFRRSFTETNVEKEKLTLFQTTAQDAHKKELADVIERVSEEKSRELADFKEQMLKDHMEEMEQLMVAQQAGAQELLQKREQEMYDLRRSMNQWKQETTERIAAQLQKEFHLEYERRLENAHLGGRASKSSSCLNGADSSGSQLSAEHNPVQLINQLKKVVQKLREENLSLRKVLVGKNVAETMPIHGNKQQNLMEFIAISSGDESGSGMYPQRQHRSPESQQRIRSASSGTRSPPQVVADMGALAGGGESIRSRPMSSSRKTPTPTPLPRQQTPVKDVKSPEIRSRPQSRSSGSFHMSHQQERAGNATPVPMLVRPGLVGN